MRDSPCSSLMFTAQEGCWLEGTFPSPATAPEKRLMLVRESHTLVGKPQEEGMMSAAASFPQYETKVIEPVGDEITSEGVGDET